MKVNFDGSFRQISEFLKGPKPFQSGQTGAQGFTDVLGSIAPDREKLLENQVKSTGSDEPGGPMAMYNSVAPTSLLPELESQSADSIEVPSVKGEGQGVKTPTLVSVRRVPTQDEFSRLGRSEREHEVQKLVQEAGRRHGIDPLLSMAVVSQESAFNTNAVSRDGHFSKGLFQLLDSTGNELHSQLREKGQLSEKGQLAQKGSYEPFDPSLNIELGVSYLRRLHEIFSTATTLPNDLKTTPAANSSSLEKLAVAAFNAGEGRVASAQQRAKRQGQDPSVYEQVEAYLPDSTREYVAQVTRAKGVLEGRFQG